mmetsp:Transcript_1004/g.3028  ORF Transcript_1004/g.3028 Transcript_1004/m.3028 type:complete len:249 (+) Transcript_1004:149-895(+)
MERKYRTSERVKWCRYGVLASSRARPRGDPTTVPGDCGLAGDQAAFFSALWSFSLPVSTAGGAPRSCWCLLVRKLRDRTSDRAPALRENPPALEEVALAGPSRFSRRLWSLLGGRLRHASSPDASSRAPRSFSSRPDRGEVDSRLVCLAAPRGPGRSRDKLWRENDHRRISALRGLSSAPPASFASSWYSLRGRSDFFWSCAVSERLRRRRRHLRLPLPSPVCVFSSLREMRFLAGSFCASSPTLSSS